jgi:lipoprotein-anchoring transpeptidase ErfK/SrfK
MGLMGTPVYLIGQFKVAAALDATKFRDSKDTLFRIHGTTEPETIGHAVSSGCIRMLNQDVIDLYSRVPIGANVVVR